MLFLALVVQITSAQEKTISGIISNTDGLPLPGATVLIKGTATGTSTDFDGKYSINANTGTTLVFSFIGYTSKEITVQNVNIINLTLEEDAHSLDEVVVTALGISREKKSLGYSSQKVGGDEVSAIKVDNVVNSLSGKVSGVQIKANNNFGGSSNFLIRGVSSLTGNNQPLFVIDGVPISNKINNSKNQQAGSTGYDYGNAASDINPDDIESINILKGAAASAVYGSQAANGVVIITTKKGKAGKTKVSITSSITIGSIDKNTFAEYQNQYGAGYGPYYGSTGYFNDIDVNGNGIEDLVVPTTEDASYGGKFDPSLLVYQWDAFVPGHENYLTATPYQAAQNTPIDFFETTYQTNNSVALSGGTDVASYRLGYTNFETTGISPNSKLNKNIVNFSGSLQISDKLKVGSTANLVVQKTIGRNSTGYNDNLMSQFRQWWQVNVDVKDQKRIFDQTGQNYTWNASDPIADPLTPIYWDNPYWTRYKNYQTDNRNRFYGNFFATYNVTNWLDITAKAAIDTYNDLREERRAVGSVPSGFGILELTNNETSGYARYDIASTNYNYDLMFNINTNITDDLSLSGLAGINIRKQSYSYYKASTSGGLKVPGLYALSNSVNAVPFPVETLQKKQVNGFYAQASFGYKDFLYLDITDRYDISSTLPKENNEYNYYGASTSILFSNLIEADWLNFGKIRGGYAEVGSDLPANNVYDTYSVLDPFGSASLFSYPGTKQNSQLVPERTKEIEFGLEGRIFNNRIGFDITWYKKNTENQLMPVSTTTATGFTRRWVNAGEIQNKGMEIGLNLVPIQTDNFTWNFDVNWSKNKNLVVDLYGDTENISLASYQGGISINATKGQPYGTIRGTGFKYHDNGQRIVNTSGYYSSEADQVLGDANPEWNGGFSNTFTYKNLSLSFLIDVQKGGDVYSLDMHYGQGTGVLAHTAGLNELGNPIRNPVTTGADSGGILNPGVQADGTTNTIRARADYYGGAFYWGNSNRNPAALTVYDAGYVKLRELALKFNMPTKWFNNKISAASLSLVGRNLWIIDKSVPYADPESGLGANNSQGYISGSYPTTRTAGLTLNLEF